MRKKIHLLSLVTSGVFSIIYFASFIFMFFGVIGELACTCSIDTYGVPLMVSMSLAFLGVMFTIFAIMNFRGKVNNASFSTVTTFVGAAVSFFGFVFFFYFASTYIYYLTSSDGSYLMIVILPIILSIAGIIADIALVVMEIICLSGKGDKVELYAAEKTEQAKAKWENAKRERYAKASGDASTDDATVAPADRNAFVFSIASVCLSIFMPIVGLGFGIAALNIEKKHPHKLTFRLSLIGCILSVIAFIVWLWVLAFRFFG